MGMPFQQMMAMAGPQQQPQQFGQQLGGLLGNMQQNPMAQAGMGLLQQGGPMQLPSGGHPMPMGGGGPRPPMPLPGQPLPPQIPSPQGAMQQGMQAPDFANILQMLQQRLGSPGMPNQNGAAGAGMSPMLMSMLMGGGIGQPGY